METAPENTSGQGRSAVIPQEIRGWNWGAFFFGWLWGIPNRVGLSLLSAIPYVGVIMLIVLGVKGNEWAWRHKKWDSIEHFKSTQRRWGIAGVVVLAISFVLGISVVLLDTCAAPSTTAPIEPPSMSGTLHLTSWSKPEKSDMTPEELQKAIAEGKLKVVLNPVDPVNDTKYWNTDWDVIELSRAISSINKQYHKTHTYVEEEFDCNDMAVGLWNALQAKNITSVMVGGNLDLDNESFAESNHTWLLVTYVGIRLFAVETTNGEVYQVLYDIDSDDEGFKQYLEGYYFALPSDLRAAVKERW